MLHFESEILWPNKETETWQKRKETIKDKKKKEKKSTKNNMW